MLNNNLVVLPVFVLGEGTESRGQKGAEGRGGMKAGVFFVV